MLNVRTRECQSRYYNAGAEIWNSGNKILRYNYFVELMNDQVNPQAHFSVFPHVLIVLFAMPQEKKILILAIVLVSTVVPVANIISCMLLVLGFILALYKWVITHINNANSEKGLEHIIEYNDLCFDQDSNMTPGIHLIINFSQFNESENSKITLKELLGINPTAPTFFFTACRKGCKSWLGEVSQNSNADLIIISISLVVGVIVMAMVNSFVLK